MVIFTVLIICSHKDGYIHSHIQKHNTTRVHNVDCIITCGMLHASDAYIKHYTQKLKYTQSVGWLDLFNAELSLKRYWRVLRSQELCVCGGGGGLYLTLHCHCQNDTCIKTSSDKSYFNVSLIVKGQSQRRCPQITTFEEKRESNRSPFAYQPNALPLGNNWQQPLSIEQSYMEYDGRKNSL